MAHFEPRGLGWLPSLPDFRDFTPKTPPIAAHIERLRRSGAAGAASDANVDLREYFADVDDQQTMRCSTAHACVGLVQYFERRAHARVVRPSRLFLHQSAVRLARTGHHGGADFRTAFKAMKCCGIPPEEYWPYDSRRLEMPPDGFLYSFVEPYRALTYVRLDDRNESGSENLQTVKTFLAAGFPAVFGLAMPKLLPRDGDIPYRPTFDSIQGGQALMAVGYSDDWLRGSRGALLVRNSWGTEWGDAGYGWLPYAYVEEQLAVEFWTLMRPDWLDSGEFDVPDLPM
ncbi:MAG TPA: C1 family peptidase [Pirellulales bacterium]|jgi:C1A family cysteine protease